MKETILIITLWSLIILSFATGKGHGVSPEADPKFTCPTLDQLLKEKAEQEKAARDELGRERRALIKDRISEILGGFPTNH